MDSERQISGDVVPFKIIACAVISLVNILGVFLPIFNKDWALIKGGITNYNCFLAGILFSSAISQMLPESEKTIYLDHDGPDKGFPIAHFFVGLGFSLTMACQFLIEGIKKHRHDKRALDILLEENSEIILNTNDKDFEDNFEIEVQKNQPSLMTLLVVFTIENTLTGIAVGIQRNSASVIVLVLSTASTDWIESVLFCMAVAVAYNGSPHFKRIMVKYAAIYSLIATCTTIFWVALMTSLPFTPLVGDISGAIMAVLAGSFIYIACKDILAKEIDEVEITGNYPPPKTLFKKVGQFLLGFLIVDVVVYLQGMF